MIRNRQHRTVMQSIDKTNARAHTLKHARHAHKHFNTHAHTLKHARTNLRKDKLKNLSLFRTVKGRLAPCPPPSYAAAAAAAAAANATTILAAATGPSSVWSGTLTLGL